MRRLLPGLLHTEQTGCRVNIRTLARDTATYSSKLSKLDRSLARKLKMPEFKTGKPLAYALVESGYATEGGLGVTPKGNLRSNREAVEEAVTDRWLVSALTYRGQLATCLQTFMRPWLATARETGGLIYSSWATHRTEAGRGARTGRLASSPNFQNLPKDYSGAEAVPPRGYPALPIVRAYVAPRERGHVLLDRDYNQHELRILAHFAGGSIADGYLRDKWTDLHEHARSMINNMLGTDYPRKPIKNMGFGILYGMGAGAVAKKNSTDVGEARRLKAAYLEMAPGIADLYREMRERTANDEPIFTWGGRAYYVEEPRVIRGRLCHFDYKLVNVLIQGSAADITKEAMCRYYEAGHHLEAPLILTAHDEILTSAFRDSRHIAMDWLREAMEFDALDVPMPSEGKYSNQSWAALRDYDKKGKQVCRR